MEDIDIKGVIADSVWSEGGHSLNPPEQKSTFGAQAGEKALAIFLL
jgi:hypothetical protein